MIRPLTVATFLIACGSGLYLYQSKHEVQLLDRTIEKTVHDTSALREQSRLLATEWNMLNDPERLRQFSDTYLNLKTIDPKQYTSLGDLDIKLPAPRLETPASSGDEDPPVSVDAAPLPESEPAASSLQRDTLPVPPLPVARPVPTVAVVTRPPETKIAAPRPFADDASTRQVAANDIRPFDQHAAERRAVSRSVEPRPEVRVPSVLAPRPILLAAPRPRPVSPPAPAQPTLPPVRQASASVALAAPYTGSVLGMAHGSMPPAPRPIPVNATYAN